MKDIARKSMKKAKILYDEIRALSLAPPRQGRGEGADALGKLKEVLALP